MLPKLTLGHKPTPHAFEFVRVLRDKQGEPVTVASGTIIRRTVRTNSPRKVAAFDRTNCFTN